MVAENQLFLKRLYEMKSDEVSYLPQDLGLVNQLSSYHNIYTSKLQDNSTFYNLINLVKPFKRNLDEVQKILKELYIEDKLLTKSFNLSGGQKQRVAIAKSIYSKKRYFLS